MSDNEERLPDFNFEAVFAPQDFLLFWDESTSPEQTRIEVAFLRSELALEQPRRILDVPCGFGRHAVRLAALGHSVMGIDAGPEFVKMARESAAERGVEAEFRVGDMRSLDFQAEFDRAICLFTSIGYFSEEENFTVMRNFARALRPGGLLCIDTLNRDSASRFFMPNTVTERGSDLAVDRNSFDPVSGRIVNKRFIIRSGRRRETPFFVRIYCASELSFHLRRAGFSGVRFYGDWEAKPLTLNSWRMIAVATK